MNYKLLLKSLVQFVILSAFCVCVISTCSSYQEVGCKPVEPVVLSGNRTVPSCIKWIINVEENSNEEPEEPDEENSNEEPEKPFRCVLHVKTNNNELQPILIALENFTKGFVTTMKREDDGCTEDGSEITLTEDSSVFALNKTNSICLSWTTSDVNDTIFVKFQELIYQEFPLLRHGESDGHFDFPNANLEYAAHSAYFWILSNDTVNADGSNITSMELKVETTVLSKENGDILIVGMGNESEVFKGPKSVLLTTTRKNPLRVHVTTGEAYVILLTGWNNPRKTSQFKVNWQRLVTGSVEATEEPSTPLPDSWRKAITLCIKGPTKGEFKNNHTAFQGKVAEIATHFADQNKIVVRSTPISPDNIQIQNDYIFEFGKNNSKGVMIVMTIVDKYDPTVATFTSSQLNELFETPKHLSDLKNEGYEIVPCEGNPDYWNWFWAACIAFFLCISIVLIVWYLRHRDFFGEKDDDKELIRNLENFNFPVDNDYVPFTKESLKNVARDTIAHSHLENNTDSTNVQPFVGQNCVFPEKAKVKRQASAPVKLLHSVNASTASPRSILRNRQRPLSFEATPPNTEETEHIYEKLDILNKEPKPRIDEVPLSITLCDEEINDETQESKL